MHDRSFTWLRLMSVLFSVVLLASLAQAAKTIRHTFATQTIKPHFVALAPAKDQGAPTGVDPRTAKPSSAVQRLVPRSDFDEFVRPILEQYKRQVSTSTQVKAEALPSQEGSRNFGGLLVAPSYQAIPFGSYIGKDGATRRSMATMTADFNRDGSPDLATLDSDGNISILFNDGKAHFATPIVTNASQLAQADVAFKAAVAVDIDADGYPDIVAASKMANFDTYEPGPHFIYVFHNNRDGRFSLSTTIQVITSSWYDIGSLIVEDVNGDGVLDIVALSNVYDGMNSNITIQTFLGQSGGVFDPATDIETSLVYEHYDIALPNRGALLQTLNGKLNLVFEAMAYDPDNYFLLAGTSVIALPVNGDGTFSTTPSAQVDFASAYGSVSDNSGGLSLADLNNDGIPDITLNMRDGYLYSALGKPDGTFGNPILAVSGWPIVVTSGWALIDVNNDGYLDFFDYDRWYTTIWPGNGDGTFANPTYVYSTAASDTGAHLNSPGSNLAVADFNGDHLQDVAIVDAATVSYNRASIFLANGNGSFQAAPAAVPLDDPEIDPNALSSMVSLDLNGDGKMDILHSMAAPSGERPLVAALSDGKGNFAFRNIGTLGGGKPLSGNPIVGEFNGDGLQDIVYATRPSSPMDPNPSGAGLAVALSNGDGTLKDAVALDTGSLGPLQGFITGISVGDINGDGKIDVVAAYHAYPNSSQPSGYLTALGGDGTFQPLELTPYGSQLWYTKLADLDGDGNLDLLLADVGPRNDPSQAEFSIIYGDGSGIFQSPNARLGGYFFREPLVGDLNGDGKQDLVLLSAGSWNGSEFLDPAGAGALVWLNTGNRQFTSGGHYEPGRSPGAAMLADFNGDGILDMYFGNDSVMEATPDFYGAQILLGNGDGTFGSPFTAQLPPATAFLQPGDYLQDGALDLAANSAYGDVILLLNQGGSSIGLTASLSSVSVGGTEQITATVTPTMAYRPVPTGTITLTENGAVVGTGTLSGGSATIAISDSPVGSHTLSATYSGDEAFNVNTNGASIGFTVTAPPEVPPSFSLQVSATQLSLSRGSTGTINLTALANSTYAGTVTFTVSGPLNGLNVQITPAQVTLAAGQSATAAVTVSTVAPTTASLSHAGADWLGTLGGASFLGMLGLVLPTRKKKLPRMFITVICAVVLLAAMAGFTGCGNGNPYKAADKGSSTFVVTATPSVSGVSAQAVNITVTVQ